MTTSRTFATISYNTKDYLKSKLDELIDLDEIDFYAFITHLAEEDEKKDHIHLYIVPSHQLNTKTLLKQLDEVDKKCPNKPLGCMPAVASRFADWYMYVLHDKSYLLSKGQSRKHSYTLDDIVCSNFDFLNDCIHRIDRSKWVGHEKIINAVKNDVAFKDLVRTGQIPVQLVKQYEYMFHMIKLDYVQRNGRQTHSPKVDNEDFASSQGLVTFDKEEKSPAKRKNLARLIDPDTGEVIDNISSFDSVPTFDDPFNDQSKIDF